MTELFPEYKWDGFIDKNCREDSCNGIKVVNLEQFAKRYRYRTKILISNMANTEEIIGDLLKTGVYREDIYILSEFDIENMKDIYFLPECMERLTDDDGAFIDIGCYDGKDSLTYLRRKTIRQRNIYAFEPDRKNYELCKKIWPRIRMLRYFLWRCLMWKRNSASKEKERWCILMQMGILLSGHSRWIM